MTITSSRTPSDMERSDDILLGAYLMSHLRQHCENCKTYITPQWRKGWFSEVLNHSVLLCNACGLKFHKGQYCTYCKYVYGKEQKTEEDWLTCVQCQRWVHRDCENRHGNLYTSMNDDEELLDEEYCCPDCRSGVSQDYFARVHSSSFQRPSNVSSSSSSSSLSSTSSSEHYVDVVSSDKEEYQYDDDMEMEDNNNHHQRVPRPSTSFNKEYQHNTHNNHQHNHHYIKQEALNAP